MGCYISIKYLCLRNIVFLKDMSVYNVRYWYWISDIDIMSDIDKCFQEKHIQRRIETDGWGSAVLERLCCLPSYSVNVPSISPFQGLSTCHCFCLECFLRIASVIFLTSGSDHPVEGSPLHHSFPFLSYSCVPHFLTLGTEETQRTPLINS